MRSVYVYDHETGRIIPKAERAARRSSGPNVISDHVEPFVSMVDGQTYDSKRKYEASVRARGYDIVGNDTAYLMREEPREYGRGLDEAWAQAMREHGQ